MKLGISSIVSNVMNDHEVLKLVYKEIDLLDLTRVFAFLPINFLVIGRTRVWMILMSTCHPNHFVGTMRVHHLRPTLGDRATWSKLHDFIFRFSTPGATIVTFVLQGDEVPEQPVWMMKKTQESLFQLPDCTKHPIGGVTIFHHISIPIAKSAIKEDRLPAWVELRNALKGQMSFCFEHAIEEELIDTTSRPLGRAKL